MKKYILIIITIFMLSGCGEKTHKVSNSDQVKLIKDQIEVHSDINLLDLLEIDNNVVENITKDKKINTNKLGKKTIEFSYRFEGEKYIYKFNIFVVDTEAPRVFGGTNRTVNKGFNGDPCDLISYGDNHDGVVNCQIEGSYDLNTVGTYHLVFKLSDSSNNVTDVNVTLNVVNPTNNKKTNNTVTKKTSFTDIVAQHKNDNTEIGIDVSKWQGDIDFNKVRDAGATFVMMRIGVQVKTLEDLQLDSYYEKNIKNAKAAGLKVGVYLYSIATSAEEAKKHAEWVLNKLDGETLELPIVFDWENWSKWNTYKISFYDINNIANTFIETVKDAGYEGMLYSSKFYLDEIWENKNNHPVWLAHYTSKTSYTGDYVMWQLSNTGKIDGINGDVDIDILYKR